MLRRTIGLLLGLAYAFVYGFLGIMATGGGHGNYFWLFAFFPKVLGISIFAVIGFLAADLRSTTSKILLGFVLFFHYAYAIIVLLVDKELFRDAANFVGTEPFNFMAIVYLFGQVVIWGAILKSLLKFSWFETSGELDVLELK